MFSFKYWGILKNTSFEEHLRTMASVDNFKCFICSVLILWLILHVYV